MVDFGSEATMSRSAEDIVRIIILQDRDYCAEAIALYAKNREKGVQQGTSVLQGSVLKLFLDVQAMKRRRDAQGYPALLAKVRSRKAEELIEAFITIDEFLDELGLTKLDTRPRLGPNLVERNKSYGG